jgi:hypothetical protein
LTPRYRPRAERRSPSAGPEDEGGRGFDYPLFVKGNQPGLQRAIYDATQQDGPHDLRHFVVERELGICTPLIPGREHYQLRQIRQ